jgi:alkylglycerol monooxygenase
MGHEPQPDHRSCHAPVFFLLIALEFAWGVRKGRNTYRLADAINSISLGMLSQISAVFTRLLRVGIYTAVYASVSLVPPSPCLLDHLARLAAGAGLLRLLLLLAAPHGPRGGRALGRARGAPPEPGLQPVHRAAPDQQRRAARLDLLPADGVAGVPPLVFGIVALVDLLYQFWVHTEHVPKLGWFDRWFCSPSNHRVHHAVNDNYLDKNYGGILIVWDRLFGTFRDEDLAEPCVYGTRGRSTAGTRCGPTPRSTGRWRRTAGTPAAGATSCACGSSRRAGGRPTWRSAFRSRPSTWPGCRCSSRRSAPRRPGLPA